MAPAGIAEGQSSLAPHPAPTHFPNGHQRINSGPIPSPTALRLSYPGPCCVGPYFASLKFVSATTAGILIRLDGDTIPGTIPGEQAKSKSTVNYCLPYKRKRFLGTFQPTSFANVVNAAFTIGGNDSRYTCTGRREWSNPPLPPAPLTLST